ncbi:SANT/Myb_domain [Hexamita inflata]|uniref:SANT/Myb domain n=1 Tax=Hexamita inflata TaxID=28002 RepID=A0AA86P3X4_9EUKA|nr:SANT/Myb domain [Hexamita inflata]
MKIKNKLLEEQMLSNFVLLQQIHDYSHQINQIKTKCTRVQRDRWSREEDAILFDTVQIIGAKNCITIAALIGSKTSSQVYQRLRYLRETIRFFSAKNDQHYNLLQ